MTTTASKFFIAFLSLFILTEVTGVAQTNEEIEYYMKLNDKEKRLPEFKDSKEAIILKLKQVEYINKSRKKYNVQPLKLNILASRVANRICVEGAQNGFMGHFGLNGSTPFIRYAEAGGMDHVSENASSISSSETLDTDPKTISSQMREMHDSFMAEKKPNDGHKQNCIDKHHNYVGLGYATHKGEFRYYEEFLDRYIDFKPVSHTAKRNSTITLSFKPIDSNMVPLCIMAHYLPEPKSLTPAQINRLSSYKDYSDKQEFTLWKPDIPAPDANGFINLNMKFKKKGYYYIKIYLDDKNNTKKTMSTKGKIEGSGVVFLVN